MTNEFVRGKLDNTLFLKTKGEYLLILHVYVDDIIFGATSDELYKEFAELMSNELEMRKMRELTLFLGLQFK